MLRGAPFAAGLLTALLAAACGGPLDRKDGALRIQMTGVPDEVDALELTLHAGAREFTLTRARPANDLVDDFSAVPAGQWTLDLTLLAATTAMASYLERVDHSAGPMLAGQAFAHWFTDAGAEAGELLAARTDLVDLIDAYASMRAP